MQITLDKETVLSILEQIVSNVKGIFDNQFPELNQSYRNYLFFGLMILGFFLISKLVGFLFKFALIFVVGLFVGFYVMKKMGKE